MRIPVFHDDQHGTAITVAAAIRNGLVLQGKTLAEARMETMAAADVIEWFAEEAKRSYGRVIPARGPGIYQLAIKEPVGPVAAFTPWNFPINQVVRKLSAALASGCSIIVKAPEETPASPAQLIRAFADAGAELLVSNTEHANALTVLPICSPLEVSVASGDGRENWPTSWPSM